MEQGESYFVGITITGAVTDCKGRIREREGERMTPALAEQGASQWEERHRKRNECEFSFREEHLMPPRCLHGEGLSRCGSCTHKRETGLCGGSAHAFFETGRKGVCVMVKNIRFWHSAGYGTQNHSWPALSDLSFTPRPIFQPRVHSAPFCFLEADPQWATLQVFDNWLPVEFAQGDSLEGSGKRRIEGMFPLLLSCFHIRPLGLLWWRRQ